MSRRMSFDGEIPDALELLDISSWKRGDLRGEVKEGVDPKVDEDRGDVKDGAGSFGAVEESDGALEILTQRPSRCVS
jgi:hypothetical protein